MALSCSSIPLPFNQDSIRSRSLAGLLGIAANNLDLVRRHGLTSTIHLERDILDQEGPYFVAESVGVEASLLFPIVSAFPILISAARMWSWSSLP